MRAGDRQRCLAALLCLLSMAQSNGRRLECLPGLPKYGFNFVSLDWQHGAWSEPSLHATLAISATRESSPHSSKMVKNPSQIGRAVMSRNRIVCSVLAGFALTALLFEPAAVVSADDPALVPTTVNTSPGPEYGDATRRFQGIPGIARAAGGRLWATWYSGGTNEGPENYVVVVTSRDDGGSWSPIRLVIDPPGAVRAFDPNLWVDPSGRLWLFYAQADGWWDGRMGVWAVVTEEADSLSPRWSAPRRIADGVMLNKPTVKRDDDWLLPIAVWSHEPRQNVPWDSSLHIPRDYLRWDPTKAGTHVYRSRDAGATFELLGTARVPDVVSDEHMIVERKDSSLWMLVRTGSTMRESGSLLGSSGISESVSVDNGRTGHLEKCRRFLTYQRAFSSGGSRQADCYL